MAVEGTGAGVRLKDGSRMMCPESVVVVYAKGLESDVSAGGRLGIGDSGGKASLPGGAEAPGKPKLRGRVLSRGMRANARFYGDGVQVTWAGAGVREGEPAGSEGGEEQPEAGSGCTGGEGEGKPLRELAQEWVCAAPDPSGG